MPAACPEPVSTSWVYTVATQATAAEAIRLLDALPTGRPLRLAVVWSAEGRWHVCVTASAPLADDVTAIERVLDRLGTRTSLTFAALCEFRPILVLTGPPADILAGLAIARDYLYSA